MKIDSIMNHLPQEFSTQTPGPIPPVNHPDLPLREKAVLFFNNTALAEEPRIEDGNLMLPTAPLFREAGISLPADVPAYAAPAYIREALDAEVWWDKPEKCVVVTCGSEKNCDILRNIGGKLYMNGKPYYEISFNKFDLKWQLCADKFPHNEFRRPDQFSRGEEALRQLHEAGFRSIRVFDNILGGPETLFDPDRRRDYFEVCDRMFDLCDKYEIQVVSCLSLPTDIFCKYLKDESGKYVSDGTNVMDLICDPGCPARQHMYEYIDAYVGRYKNRRTILMWEIVNEGNLDADIGDQIKRTCYSAAQLGNFYADCAARIHAVDPDRLVTGGDGLLRSAQWHLYQSVMAGASVDWNKDTLEDRLNAYWVLHHGVDAISVHGYAVGYPDDAMCRYDRGDGKYETVTWKLLMEEARRLGKILYNGETGDAGVDTDGSIYRNDNPARAITRDRFLTEIIEAGVQLSHWWAFHSDREGFTDDRDWNICPAVEPNSLAVIAAANQRLRARYIINYAASL